MNTYRLFYQFLVGVLVVIFALVIYVVIDTLRPTATLGKPVEIIASARASGQVRSLRAAGQEYLERLINAEILTKAY